MGIFNRQNVIAWAKEEEGCKMAVAMSINNVQAKLSLEEPSNLHEKLERRRANSSKL